MKAFNIISFTLVVVLTVAGTSLLITTLIPSIERIRVSGIINDAIEQLKTLDILITQLASLGKDSELTFNLKVRNGEFFVDNFTNSFKFRYETKYLPFKGVLKKEANLVIVSGSIPNVSCSLKEGSCGTDEICLFSLAKRNNSHLGNCSVYPYKMCCKNLESRIKTGCDETETRIFSLFKAENSHASLKGYNLSICIKPEAVCRLAKSCTKEELCLLSFYKDTNSHAAECNYYENQLCCYWVIKEELNLILKYDDIKIVGEEIFPAGDYYLCLRKIGEENGTSIIKIASC
jgi:hypothetical protein